MLNTVSAPLSTMRCHRLAIVVAIQRMVFFADDLAAVTLRTSSAPLPFMTRGR